jgi:hypothetical protein
VNGGKKGKSHGIEGSANANDVWVWMRPHIKFSTIGKCDLLSFFLLIESLPAACRFHPFFKMELLHMRFYLFSFSILAPYLFYFRGSFFLLGRDPTHWKFLGESLGELDQSWDKE